jgi:ABC-2 type transport system permease protein
MTTSVRHDEVRLPSLAHLVAVRIGYENRTFFRRTQAWAFTLLFPVVFLLLFGFIFTDKVDGTNVTYAQLLFAGIIGSSIMSTGFVSLAIGIAVERDQGTLKRLGGLPIPRSAYFLGKVGHVIIVTILEMVILGIMGVLLFDVSLPTSASKLLTLVWVFVLGITAASLTGIAVGGLVSNGKSAPAVVNLPFVVLQLVSGVFIPFNQLPGWLSTASGIFPLRWIVQGMRSVFLPDGFKTVERAHNWQHGLTALVLGAWCVAGFRLCLRTFNWLKKSER